MRTARFKRFLTSLVAWLAFLWALLWGSMVVVGLVSTEVTRTIPYSFLDWVVSIQIRSDCLLGSHGATFYIVRFFTLTALTVAVGALGFFHLRRIRRRRE